MKTSLQAFMLLRFDEQRQMSGCRIGCKWPGRDNMALA